MKPLMGQAQINQSNLCITIYKDDTLCYTSTKVENLPYSWLLHNDE